MRSIKVAALASIATTALLLLGAWVTATSRSTGTTFLPLVVGGGPPAAATPTATVAPVEVLPGHFSYAVSGFLSVIGELQNNTDDYLTTVSVIANLKDAEGTVLESTFTYLPLDNLPPGGRSCFRMLFDEHPDWTSYEFEDFAYRTDGRPAPDLTILNDSGEYDPNPSLQWYLITGEVRNDHTTRVELVKVVASVYSGSTITGCEFAIVEGLNLNPGDIRPFRHIVFGRDYADVTSYRLQADGSPVSETPALSPVH